MARVAIVRKLMMENCIMMMMTKVEFDEVRGKARLFSPAASRGSFIAGI
jgi:hypothetical protein